VKKTSVYLEEQLDEALALRAAEEGVTKAEFIRRTLSGAVGRPSRPVSKAIGIVRSGRGGQDPDTADLLSEAGFGT
jgi:hypothetical protein